MIRTLGRDAHKLTSKPKLRLALEAYRPLLLRYTLRGDDLYESCRFSAAADVRLVHDSSINLLKLCDAAKLVPIPYARISLSMFEHPYLFRTDYGELVVLDFPCEDEGFLFDLGGEWASAIFDPAFLGMDVEKYSARLSALRGAGIDLNELVRDIEAALMLA